MTHTDIIHDLSNRVFYPVYFLMGEAPFYIDMISDYIQENVLSAEEKEFNQTVLYGKDSDVSSIINAAKRYPLMATHQVIIVKEAQSLAKIDALEPYIQNPLSSTILVLCYKYKTIDKRKTFAKTLMKKGVVYESPRFYENQMPAWIQTYVKEKGFQIIPEAAQILAESLEPDLSKIANELSKVFILIPPRSTISPQIIEENIGISKDFNVFELVNAIGNRDVYKANAIISYFTSNAKDISIFTVINSLFLFFRNLLIYHTLKDKSRNNAAAVLKIQLFLIRNYEQGARNFRPAQVLRALAYLREYDLKSKGVDNQSSTHDELLKELVFFLLH